MPSFWGFGNNRQQQEVPPRLEQHWGSGHCCGFKCLMSHCQSEPRQKAVRGKALRSVQWASLPCWQAPGPHESPATIGYYSFSLFPKQDNALGARVAENRTARSPGGPEPATLVLISHKHTHPLCLGVGVSVLQGGNREASVPSAGCLASRMSACSVARFPVPGDATQWNVS